MKKTKNVVTLPDALVNQIEELVTYYNQDVIFNKGLMDTATLNDFVLGAIDRELERLQKHNEIFNEIKYNGIRKPTSKLRNNFKGILKEIKMKQTDLSEITGISDSELSIVLNNKRALSLDYFLLIWMTIGCPDLERVFHLQKNS